MSRLIGATAGFTQGSATRPWRCHGLGGNTTISSTSVWVRTFPIRSRGDHEPLAHARHAARAAHMANASTRSTTRTPRRVRLQSGNAHFRRAPLLSGCVAWPSLPGDHACSRRSERTQGGPICAPPLSLWQWVRPAEQVIGRRPRRCTPRTKAQPWPVCAPCTPCHARRTTADRRGAARTAADDACGTVQQWHAVESDAREHRQGRAGGRLRRSQDDAIRRT